MWILVLIVFVLAAQLLLVRFTTAGKRLHHIPLYFLLILLTTWTVRFGISPGIWSIHGTPLIPYILFILWVCLLISVPVRIRTIQFTNGQAPAMPAIAALGFLLWTILSGVVFVLIAYYFK